MLATSVRVRPCNDLWSFSSDGRVTTILSPSTAIVMATWNVFFSSPLGPLTLTEFPLAETVTPFGTGTGTFPIRDIVISLPDQREELAAGARLARLTVGH